MTRRLFIAAVALAAALRAGPAAAIAPGQTDDFEDGTTMGWSEGLFSPNPPVNIAGGGPGGPGDHFLSNTSSGEFLAAGGRMTMFNTTQWAGNYVAGGVGIVRVRLANFGSTPLAVRLAFEGAATQISSTTAFALPADGVWYSATFGLGAGDLTIVGGLASVTGVLSNVTMMRIISRDGGPGWQGDEIAATLGVDRIEAATLSAVGDPQFTTGAQLRAAPNPFTTSTVVHFSLEQTGPVRLDVFDVRGRRVRVLLALAATEPGDYSTVWDGQDDSGSRLPAGGYFIRLRGAGDMETRKIQLRP